MIWFLINYIGRYGARFPTSGKTLNNVIRGLALAPKDKNLTKEGMELFSHMKHFFRCRHLVILIISGKKPELSLISEFGWQKRNFYPCMPKLEIMSKANSDFSLLAVIKYCLLCIKPSSRIFH